jgi:hypothetical protein
LAPSRSVVGYIGLAAGYNTHNLGDALMLPLFRRELVPARLYRSLPAGTEFTANRL